MIASKCSCWRAAERFLHRPDATHPVMYIPSHFAETRPEEMHRIIRGHPLGVLIAQGQAGPEADHIPFEFDADRGAHGTLLAHIARANTLWQRCPTGTPVMVVFRGAHAYVSPNWYLTQHEAHRQVPTWNYEVVHASGTIVVHDDDRFVRRLLARQVNRHEATEPDTAPGHRRRRRTGRAPRVAAATAPLLPAKIIEQRRRDGFFGDAHAVLRHRRGQRFVPDRRHRWSVIEVAAQPRRAFRCRLVVTGAQPPGTRAEAADRPVRDSQARPVEIAVITQPGPCAGELREQRALRRRRHAVGADQRSAARTESVGRDRDQIRVLADEDLTRGHIERRWRTQQPA